MIDRLALIGAADELEMLAIDLGDREVQEMVAIESLVRAANGDIGALRRAHRHCRQKVSELWPAEGPLLRAFFYLSAARRQMELEGGTPIPALETPARQPPAP